MRPLTAQKSPHPGAVGGRRHHRRNASRYRGSEPTVHRRQRVESGPGSLDVYIERRWCAKHESADTPGVSKGQHQRRACAHRGPVNTHLVEGESIHEPEHVVCKRRRLIVLRPSRVARLPVTACIIRDDAKALCCQLCGMKTRRLRLRNTPECAMGNDETRPRPVCFVMEVNPANVDGRHARSRRNEGRLGNSDCPLRRAPGPIAFRSAPRGGCSAAELDEFAPIRGMRTAGARFRQRVQVSSPSPGRRGVRVIAPPPLELVSAGAEHRHARPLGRRGAGPARASSLVHYGSHHRHRPEW